MKTILLSLSVLICFSIKAQFEIHQNGQDAPAQITADTSQADIGPFGRFEHIFYILNTSLTDTLSLEFTRIAHHHTPGWTQSLEDDLIGWALTDEVIWHRPTSLPYIMNVQPGDSVFFSVRNYNNAIAGCGIYEYIFRSDAQTPLDSITITYTIDGISCVLDNTEFESAELSNIYPNPTKNNLNIEVLTDEAQQLSIFDLNGKLLLEVTLSTGLNQIDLSHIASGAYVYCLKSGEQILKTEPLMIE